MEKTKIRIIATLVVIIVSGGAFFGVLYTEEQKRLARQKRETEDLIARIQETNEKRRAYYDAVLRQKAELREQMEKSQREYEDLLKQQPDIVAQKQTQTTKVIEQVVPVTAKEPVATSSGSSRTTKAS